MQFRHAVFHLLLKGKEFLFLTGQFGLFLRRAVTGNIGFDVGRGGRGDYGFIRADNPHVRDMGLGSGLSGADVGCGYGGRHGSKVGGIGYRRTKQAGGAESGTGGSQGQSLFHRSRRARGMFTAVFTAVFGRKGGLRCKVVRQPGTGDKRRVFRHGPDIRRNSGGNLFPFGHGGDTWFPCVISLLGLRRRLEHGSQYQGGKKTNLDRRQQENKSTDASNAKP